MAFDQGSEDSDKGWDCYRIVSGNFFYLEQVGGAGHTDGDTPRNNYEVVRLGQSQVFTELSAADKKLID